MKNLFFYISRKLALLIGVLVVSTTYAQDTYKPAVESFEHEEALAHYKTTHSQLSQSTTHARYGEASLKWEWNKTGSSVSTSSFKILSQEESPLAYGDYFKASPTLQMSIYNETPRDGHITITFSKADKTEVYFDVDMSFKGWRRLWVPFYDMKGDAPDEGEPVDYEHFKITASTEHGNLFFDDIIFSQYQDDRHQYPDEIVPFVKAGKDLAKDHWMPLISNYERIKAIEPTPVSMAIRMDLKKFEQLIDQELTIAKKYKVYINTLRDLFQDLNLNDKGETVTGPPLTFKDEQDYFNAEQQGDKEFNEVKELGRVLKKLSNFHDRANPMERKEIETMFIIGTKYFLDQGWQAGSNGGTRHHIGYDIREITEAFFTMRQLLFAHGLLEEVGASLHWLYNLGMLLDDEDNFHVNIDYLNTQSYYHLMLIFLFEKQEVQATMLRAYSKYMSKVLAQQKEIGGFKADGTTWHHNGHYPAYGIGAFKNVPRVIKTLSRTRFRISTQGHKNFKNAFLKSRLYSQFFNWGFGNAGRHPLENNSIKALKEPFLLMAYAGDPTGQTEVDSEVASAYLRLWGDSDIYNTSIFNEVHAIEKEKLSGYYTFPYAATAVHRRDNWAALIKGYSKYVWASEIYVNENRYGRYPSNGTIQLLNEKGENGSGFKQEGWDWNRYPGGTIIYLPLKELEAKKPLIMFRSDETFAGATNLDENGIFGMVLNESKGSDAENFAANNGYTGNLKAKKSVFSFGKKLICIGTNISSNDDTNPTQTTLFQNFLDNKKRPLYVGEEEIKSFPHESSVKASSTDSNWLIDAYGNGYHLLSNSTVKIKKSTQNSYHNKYSVNTGSMHPKGKGAKDTEGDYATAWIEHGFAPKDATYQYVIYPFLKQDQKTSFGKVLKKEDSFDIKQADEAAHIVMDNKSTMMGYVIFDSKEKIKPGLLAEVSKPALIMIQGDKNEETLKLSVVEPDLNFPKANNGRYKNYSQAVHLELTIEGRWEAPQTDFIKTINHTETHTTLSIECINGLPRKFELNAL